ncbi:MAG: tRNA 2-thiocytidine biosynthesis protein TtcA [Clostridiales bacterium]|nr:tRNA 2-thiocytidine biosynthesis protein TtcA [Clostridiales bacterium]
MDKYKEAERSIITTYRKTIWRPFVKAVAEYDLIDENDKIAVCISGGKDSMLLAKCLEELQKHGNKRFDLVYLCMNPGYNKENYELIVENAKFLNIPITIFDSDIFEIVTKVDNNPCYLCARMRRGFLYSKAKSLGCNKIALGHHFDDVVETILMGIFYNGQVQSMMPKLISANFENMELIRPLYKVKEKDIINWQNHNNLRFLRCACRFTEDIEKCKDGVGDSKRQEMKILVKKLKEDNPRVGDNIFNCVQNINLNTCIAWKKDGVKSHFLQDYPKK